MPRITDSFFDERREWSRRKHELFTGYHQQFAGILGRRWGSVYLVDAFAGEGAYGAGDTWVAGSPLEAAKTAEVSARRGSYDLHCINVEAHGKRFDNLMRNTEPYQQFVTNYQGKFEDYVDIILERIGRAPTLFFLDPFGLSGIEWRVISKLGRRNPSSKTELLITFNVPKFDQVAGWLDSRYARKREVFPKLLDRIVGVPDWRNIWEEQLPPRERYSKIVRFYMRRIANEFGMEVGACPILTVDNALLKYYIVFATRNDTAMRIMGNIVHGIQQRYYREHMSYIKLPPGQVSFFDVVPVDYSRLQQIEENKVKVLRADILALVSKRGRCRFDKIQDMLSSRWFGRLAEKHYRRVCRELTAEGVFWHEGRGIDDKTIIVLRSAVPTAAQS